MQPRSMPRPYRSERHAGEPSAEYFGRCRACWGARSARFSGLESVAVATLAPILSALAVEEQFEPALLGESALRKVAGPPLRCAADGCSALIPALNCSSHRVAETPWQKIFQGSPEPAGFCPRDGLASRSEARGWPAFRKVESAGNRRFPSAATRSRPSW